jgi:acyl-CoA reductase-like NAD-dependent aldehyde dehydrogenase
MISEAEAVRAEQWVQQAVAAGAQIVVGGRRDRALVSPTILTNVPATTKVLCEEIFAPVVSVIPFRQLDEAIAMVNATPFGLAAGIFTRQHQSRLSGRSRPARRRRAHQ